MNATIDERIAADGARATRYFAFGANMNSKVFTGRRGIKPEATECARLDGWALVFEQPGVRIIEPVFATLVTDLAAEVHGVLYTLSRESVERLNRTEGQGYELVSVRVDGATSGPVDAFTYTSRKRLAGHKPSRTYVEKMLHGAAENNLPEDYIDALRAVKTVHVPILSPLFDRFGAWMLRRAADGAPMNNPLVRLGAEWRENR